MPKPHLLTYPNSTTNCGLNIQTPKTTALGRHISFKPQHLYIPLTPHSSSLKYSFLLSQWTKNWNMKESHKGNLGIATISRTTLLLPVLQIFSGNQNFFSEKFISNIQKKCMQQIKSRAVTKHLPTEHGFSCDKCRVREGYQEMDGFTNSPIRWIRSFHYASNVLETWVE